MFIYYIINIQLFKMRSLFNFLVEINVSCISMFTVIYCRMDLLDLQRPPDHPQVIMSQNTKLHEIELVFKPTIHITQKDLSKHEH